MTKMRLLANLILVTSLSGCATAFQPQGLSGGYTETQLGQNLFRVVFNGNGYTNGERAEELALLRSAQVTLNNGFKYFVVIDEKSDASYSSYTAPTIANTSGSATRFGNTAYGSATTTFTGGQTFITAKPSTRNTILCFTEKPSTGGVVYDAWFVSSSLRRKYKIEN